VSRATISGLGPRRRQVTDSPLIVGIGGTIRPRSTSETALMKALEVAKNAGARTVLFGGEFLASLPHYNPADTSASAEQRRLVDTVREADGLIIASPGYHGSISGLVKNAMDCLEDLREDARPYLDGRAVGCIVAAAGHQAGGSTLAALRSIVHAMRGWPTPFGATLNAAGGLFDSEGDFTDDNDRRSITVVAEQIVTFATRWRASSLARDAVFADDATNG
jgi:FMN reductase